MNKKYLAKAPLGISIKGGRVSVTRVIKVTNINYVQYNLMLKNLSNQRLTLCTDADPLSALLRNGSRALPGLVALWTVHTSNARGYAMNGGWRDNRIIIEYNKKNNNHKSMYYVHNKGLIFARIARRRCGEVGRDQSAKILTAKVYYQNIKI